MKIEVVEIPLFPRLAVMLEAEEPRFRMIGIRTGQSRRNDQYVGGPGAGAGKFDHAGLAFKVLHWRL
ncbi:hypothetical protein [Rhizobium sp. PP-F2F-G48]|uniref:hypothetical protein n=1 Tax=Rhizobium sp. PP-F2F-G48 TaxID=2135651 RepID=UPI001046E87B|nr:hypothetical protein [Rhizobium sp. PP-F2F-G48]